MVDAESIREQLVYYGRKLEQKGMVVGPGGNISARLGQTMYVKASGCALEDMEATDYVGVDLATGDVVDGNKRPSCEVPMHSRIYNVYPNTRAVIHTHPPFSVAVASSTGIETLTATFPDFVALLGDDVPIVPYVSPAGEPLADGVQAALKDRVACILSHHGVVTTGKNLREAYFRNLLVEYAATVYVTAAKFGGIPSLDSEEVKRLDSHETEVYRRRRLEEDPQHAE